MISAISMIMEQAVMPMDTTKYNYKHQSFYQTYQPPYFWTRYRFSLLFQNISLHTSGQDIDSIYFFKISASILLDKISIFFIFLNISLHTSGQDIDSLYFCKISPSMLLDKIWLEVHDMGDPFSKLLE